VKWRDGDWFLHHDNAAFDCILPMQEGLLDNNGTTLVLLHPPYLPDIAPCYCFLFPKLESAMNGRRFDGITIQKQLQAILDEFKTQEFYKCFLKWSEN